MKHHAVFQVEPGSVGSLPSPYAGLCSHDDHAVPLILFVLILGHIQARALVLQNVMQLRDLLLIASRSLAGGGLSVLLCSSQPGSTYAGARPRALTPQHACVQ